jgi:hypothetical protein
MPPALPLTYPTRCKTCQQPVFCHTNGHGDLVLLDPPLGPPWPIHSCYLDLLQEASYRLQTDAAGRRFGLLPSGVVVYGAVPEVQRPTAADYPQPTGGDEDAEPIVRISPDWAARNQPLTTVTGRLQDLVAAKPDRDLQKLGRLEADLLVKAMGTSTAQLTVVDWEPNSYTAYFDQREYSACKAGDIVQVRLRAKSMGLRAIFVVEQLDRLHLHWS